MTDVTKRKTLIYLGLVAILMITIAAALPQLDLSPGIPLPFLNNASGNLPGESLAPFSISLSTLARAILFIILGLNIVYCGYLVLRAAPIKALLRAVVSAAGIGVVSTFIIFILLSIIRVRINIRPEESEVIPPAAEIAGPPPGSMPSVFIWLALAGICLAVILLSYQFFRQRNQPRQIGDALAEEAEKALKALEMGMDLQSVAISCYRQMSLVLQKEQDIDRAETMTAREFERLVEARGIPPAPVHELTRLFEVARYGHHPTSPGDEQKAVDCLNAIVRHTRSAKGQD